MKARKIIQDLKPLVACLPRPKQQQFWRELTSLAQLQESRMLEQNLESQCHGSITITPTSPNHSLVQ